MRAGNLEAADAHLQAAQRKARQVAMVGAGLCVAPFPLALVAVWTADHRWWWTAGLLLALGIVLGIAGLGGVQTLKDERAKLGQEVPR